ncbi:MAG TPA: mismatch-specific DNA-glycosylase [Aggregatilineales bacterium]|nr:mismatch-specific DNA-glycosylase [Anaerolineales bacterium]HRE48429.1 mismatch-specific DNA-glycosylase [Aggregatilineales bacterium]
MILPDVLAADLKVVFCGTAAGNHSASAGAYYANPRNRFWTTLYKVGLTPHLIKPADFRAVLTYGIGLTDLAKETYGGDADLETGDFDVDGLRQKIADHAPHILAFNGKTAAKVFLQAARLNYGVVAGETVGETVIWVLPSTSLAALRMWDEAVWALLARTIREGQKAEGDRNP